VAILGGAYGGYEFMRWQPDQRIEENERIAAEQETRRSAEAEEERRKNDQRTAAVLSDEERTTFVKRVQEMLQKKSCYNGAINGSTDDTQKGLDRFAASAERKDKSKLVRIELASATVSDFESWLRDAASIKGEICVFPNSPLPPPQRQAQPRQSEEPRSPPRRYDPPPRQYSPPSSGGGGPGPIQGI
jgi:hypothetical protein